VKRSGLLDLCMTCWSQVSAELITGRIGFEVTARKRMIMTIAGMASHTGHSKLIDADPLALEAVQRRKWIERQDWAFIAQLRAAISGA
jgi:hypothetical protein